MMNGDNKRKIDAARDVLVGIIPDPKGQVEQITTALIYKYMDELDRESVAAGGKRSFFTGKYAKFSWEKLMLPSLNGDQRLALYREALESLPENDKLPQIFREMLRGAHSHFRDARILGLFMKEIDCLECTDSEDLGDAYEHLLSIMGTQGDAGQFRTPRHIINFIVAAVNPQIGDRILDPACGSAGFLVSAHDHIMAANTNKRPGDRLTSTQKRQLPNNIVGRDIDPGMIRLAMVNLYLHKIKKPHAEEYDTLSDDAYWHERHDVILANPPFMTPKGGILPHDKFSIRANRSEVLFVDYIAEHLSPQGKAGLIVPEGIVSKPDRAYKELRKKLVEKQGLYAVISLPKGVFSPYSGVKTSVLLLDCTRKNYKNILFVKIENDGFELNKKRMPCDKDDIPKALKILHTWQDNKTANSLASVISKNKFAKSENFSLIGDMYRKTETTTNTFEMVKLSDVVSYEKCKPKKFEDEKRYYATGDIGLQLATNYTMVSWDKRPSRADALPQHGDVGFALMKNTKKAFIVNDEYAGSLFSTGFGFLRPKNGKILPLYLYYLLADDEFQSIKNNKTPDSIMSAIRPQAALSIKIPLPSLAKQQRIVSEIENYEKIYNNAQAIVTNWKPVIDINPNWELVKLGDQIERVRHTKKIQKSNYPDTGEYPIIDQSKNFIAGYWSNKEEVFFVTKPLIVFGDHTKCFKYVDFNFVLGADGTKLLLPKPNFNSKFFYYACKNVKLRDLGYARHYTVLKETLIPCPSLTEQEKIVEDIETEEEAAVQKCSALIVRMEQKINATIKKIWEK